MSISNKHLRQVAWIIVAAASLSSLGLGWYFGGSPEVHWSIERERLHALVEYSQVVHVGSPLTTRAKSCCYNVVGREASQDASFKVYIIGYGDGDSCIDDACGSAGRLVRSWGGTTLMFQDIESAQSFGVRAVVDEHGEHLADRLIVVTSADTTVKGIFRNLDIRDLDAALRYSLRRPLRKPSTLALMVDRLHSWANDAPRRL